MNSQTGDIYELLKRERAFELPPYLKEMKIWPTEKQLKRKPVDSNAIGRVGRNEPCPCGSGLKFKKCCLTKQGQ